MTKERDNQHNDRKVNDTGKTSEKNTPLGELHPNPAKPDQDDQQDDTNKGYAGTQSDPSLGTTRVDQ